MNEFFDEVVEIKQCMAVIRTQLKDIENMRFSCQSDPIGDRAERIMDAASDICNRLAVMGGQNEVLEYTNNDTAEYRVRTNMHATLMRKFVELMAKYKTATAVNDA